MAGLPHDPRFGPRDPRELAVVERQWDRDGGQVVCDSDFEKGHGQCVEFMQENPKCATCCCCCPLLTVVFFILISLRSVSAGHIGIVTNFGSPSPELREPGMHVCNPFASMTEFSVRTRLLEQSNSVPTNEGLLVELDVALLYHVSHDKVFEIFTTIGEAYEDVMIDPVLSAEVKSITSQNDAATLYSSGRDSLQANLTTAMEISLRPRGIILEMVLLRGVGLPSQLKISIEAKAKAEQDAERMKFVLQKEQQEALRKTIEATGIADFQQIVTDGITPQLLQWKAIEATEKFTNSENSKLVLMGNSEASLPVMFSGDVAA